MLNSSTKLLTILPPPSLLPLDLKFKDWIHVYDSVTLKPAIETMLSFSYLQ